MSKKKNAGRKNAKNTAKKVAKPKPAKGPRGYTTEGYPSAWRKSMSHDECMKLLSQLIKDGHGKKFAVKKPKPAKDPNAVSRRGYTSFGYPIVWRRNWSHDECMGFLAKGEKPPKAAGTKRVRAADTGEMVPVSRATGQPDLSMTLNGVDVEVTIDKRQYGVKVNGLQTYYTSLQGMLVGVRDQLVRAGIKKDASTISTLNDLVAAERKMTQALLDWSPGEALVTAQTVTEADSLLTAVAADSVE